MIVMFCPDEIVCEHGCMYFLTALVLVCVDLMVISSA